MENNTSPGNDPNAIPQIETDYTHHDKNPGPAPQAVFEENEEGGGKALKWILPPIVLALIIMWFLFAMWT